MLLRLINLFKKSYWVAFFQLPISKKFSIEEVRVKADYIYANNYKIKINSDYIKDSEVHIFGCGESINKITDNQWKYYKNKNTIGINYFFFNPNKLKKYFIELGSSDEIYKIIKEEVLKTDAIFYFNSRHLKENIKGNNCVKYGTFSCPSLNKKIVLEYYKKSYLSSDFLYHNSSNIETAIHYAILNGAKDIYLHGVDLSGNYFWKNTNPLACKITEIENMNVNRSIHSSVNPRFTKKNRALGFIEILKILKEILPRSVNIYTTNKNSMLNQVLEYKEIKSD